MTRQPKPIRVDRIVLPMLSTSAYRRVAPGDEIGTLDIDQLAAVCHRVGVPLVRTVLGDHHILADPHRQFTDHAARGAA